MFKARSCFTAVRVSAEIFPMHVNLGYFFLSLCVALHLPTLNFTFYFPDSSFRAASSFCNSLQAALIQMTQSHQQS